MIQSQDQYIISVDPRIGDQAGQAVFDSLIAIQGDPVYLVISK
jgi:hypothetical protein